MSSYIFDQSSSFTVTCLRVERRISQHQFWSVTQVPRLHQPVCSWKILTLLWRYIDRPLSLSHLVK